MNYCGRLSLKSYVIGRLIAVASLGLEQTNYYIYLKVCPELRAKKQTLHV